MIKFSEMMTTWRTCQNFLLDRTVGLRRIIHYDHLVSCLVLMGAFCFVSFLPLMVFRFDFPEHDVQFLDEFIDFHEDKYREWLIISIVVTAPMLVELFLDYWVACSTKVEFQNWIARGLLVFALIVPNLAMVLLVEKFDSEAAAFIPQLQASIFYSQQLTILGCLLCMMFNHKREAGLNNRDGLNISVEERTVYFLLTALVGKILLFASVSTAKTNDGLKWAGIALIYLAVFQILIIAVNVLRFLFKQRVMGQFTSHEHMSDFWYMLLVVSFAVADLIILTLSNRFSDINPHNYSCNGCHNYFADFLYVQVALTVILTVIPSRSYMLLADIKQQKLNTRLNLIRYVSHEMRTPLNTAFLGLGMLQTGLANLSTNIANANNPTAEEDEDDFQISPSKPMVNSAAVSPINERYERNGHSSGSVSAAAVRAKLTELLEGIITAESAEDMIDTVKQVQDSCKVALETLNDLLTFDKLDENKLVIEVEELDPWVFLCDAAKPFEINAKQADVNFGVCCLAEDDNWLADGFIKADQFKLSQVVRNLCSNALKFTPPNGYVDVALGLVTPEHSQLGRDMGHAVRISVTDTGAGISAENQKKLFGQYVQFNAAQLQQGKGSGLGLWISKSIVEMHGGKIWAISEGEGKGCTFGIDIPFFHREFKPVVSTPNSRFSGYFSMHHSVAPQKSPRAKSNVSLLNHQVVFQDANGVATSISKMSANQNVDNSRESSIQDQPVSPRRQASGQHAASTVSRGVEKRVLTLHRSMHARVLRQDSLDSDSERSDPAPSTTSAPALMPAPNFIQEQNGNHNVEASSISRPEPIRIPVSSGSNQGDSSDKLAKSPSWLQRLGTALANTSNKVQPSSSSTGNSSSLHHSTVHSCAIDDDVENQNRSISSLSKIDKLLQQPPSLLNVGRVHSGEKPGHSSSSQSPSIENTVATEDTVMKHQQSTLHISNKDSVTMLVSSLRPAEPEPVKENTVRPPAIIVKREPRRWERGLSILIVDDTVTNRKMMKKMLTVAGHKVYEAVDGVDCLEKLDFAVDGAKGDHSTLGATIDIVLMDEHMPRMNGPACTQLLKKRGFPGPVFAITGAVSDDEVQHFKACGAEQVFPKPLNTEALKQAVNKFFVECDG